MPVVLEKHIEITSGKRGGKPCVAGRRISVADIATMYLKMGMSLEEIGAKYDLPLAAAYSAISYYYDHKTEIEKSIATDRAFAKASRRKNSSLLQSRLKALKCG